MRDYCQKHQSFYNVGTGCYYCVEKTLTNKQKLLVKSLQINANPISL